MTLQTKTPASDKDRRSDRLAIYLSAFAFPGAGQFVQRRWIPAVLYSTGFFVCFFMIIFRAAHLWLDMIRSATNGRSFEAVSLSEFAWPLASAIIIFILGVLDTTIAYRRNRKILAQQKLDAALKQTATAIIIAYLAFPAAIVNAQIEDIFQAIRSNDVGRIDRIIEQSGFSVVRMATPDGTTPLHLAAALNRISPASLLISAGADVNARTSGGFTPLHWAASKDSRETAKMMIKIGADVNASTPAGITPLHWAASKNATNILAMLIAAGADPAAKTDMGLTPLHWATQTKSVESARWLAFKIASDQIDAEPAQAAPVPRTDDGTEPAVIEEPESAPASPGLRPEEASIAGKTLAVPIGPTETLYFIWIEPLKIWISKYETTNAQFKKFRPDHNSLFRESFKLNTPDQPVVYVSWNDARDFCNWLNKNFTDSIPKNTEFRLPTDAEWVTAASCGTSRTYPWGNEWPPKHGNYSCLTAHKEFSGSSWIRGYNDGYAVSCPVTESGASEWNIHGIAGNVWEWCEDWFDSKKQYKVRHGGSWDSYDKKSLRCEYRGFDRADTRDDTIGFRVVIRRKN